MRRTGYRRAAAVLAVAVLMASAPSRAEVNDPLEGFNRAMFTFNEKVDDIVLRPVAQAYVDVLPAPVRKGVSNFFGNIADAFSAVNSLLQGQRERAGDDLGRVIVNTSFGLGGIFDVAGDAIEKHDEDFGQTLGVWGLKPGPYLVLPFLGSSSVRDAVGLAGTMALDPVNQVTPPANQYELIGLRVVDTRAQYLGAEGVVAGAALDKYTFIRSAYLQRRNRQVYDGKPPPDDD